MKFSTYVTSALDVQRCERADGLDEVLIEPAPLAQLGTLSKAEAEELAELVGRGRMKPVLVWDILMTESSLTKTCQDLLFSYGVIPVCETEHPEDWKSWAKKLLENQGLSGDLVVMTEGPSTKHPDRNIRMEIVDLYN